MFSRIRALSLLLVCVLMTGTALAQVTTGTLTGTVTVQGDGTALPGVTVEATHVPTGTDYLAVTNESGRFTIPNARVGGPYRITTSLDGFEPAQVERVEVRLGAATEVPVTVRLAGVTETIEVVAQTDLINPNRTGSQTSVSEEAIESLPTVNRSIQDFARTNPYFSVDPQDASATRVTVAGKNNRYNTIQIDGAVNNDLFGLADTGTPGGQTDAQPISLDAIQELQLVVSPYDVRQGGFTGGGINVVTRSGTNEFSGSVYGTQRNEDFIGDGPFDSPIAAFEQSQYGFRLGGPIMQDRLFFFANGEINRREQPTGWSADGTTGNVFANPEDAIRLRDFLISEFGHDPGSLGDFIGATDSDLAFGRIDANLADNHQLTLRHNYVSAVRDVPPSRGRFFFRFPTATYTFADETNSSVVQLNSVFGSTMFNEGRIGYQTIRDVRDVPVIFPTIEIGGAPRRADLVVGTEQFSGANALDQDVLEITDDFTFVTGDHTVTVGTHNEIFEFGNLFLASFYGYYFFPSLDAFEEGIASEYAIGFATGDNPRRATSFEVRQYGVYAGDQWRVGDNLSLTLGLRADMPDFVDRPSFNPIVQDAIGFSTAETPSDDPVISPRFGFNWDPTGTGTSQLRGGIGVFAGRTPYVWISNAFANTGVESQALSARGSIPFNPDPFNQPRDLGGAGSLSVDLIDPDFELPRILRATLGYDQELFYGIRGTVEGVWSQTQKDVFYHNVNKVQTGTSPLDGRPTYSNVTGDLRDAILLTNTDKGEEMVASILLTRPFARGLTMSVGYAYMDAESAFDATSSRAISNWQFMPTQGDLYEQRVATSMFEVEDRFNAAVTYDFATGFLSHTVGLFYNAESGRPYSLLMDGDPNKDGYFTNDLLYIPGSEDEIILQDASGAEIPYSQFANFLTSIGLDPTAGRILERGEFQAPWTHLLDFHYELGLPINVAETRLTFDIMNLMNLFDSDSGRVEYVNFGTYTPVRYRGTDEETGKAIYRAEDDDSFEPGAQFSTADTRSRWQARVGIRVSF